MKENLMINGRNASDIWGVRMGDGFLDALLTPPPLKTYVTNTSRLRAGADIVPIIPQVDEREITLPFVIEATSSAVRQIRERAFLSELMRGEAVIEVQTAELSGTVYRLYYRSSSSYSLGLSRCVAKMAVKMYEPNPQNRNL